MDIFNEVLLSLYLGIISVHDILSLCFDLLFYVELRVEDFIMFNAL